MVRNLLLVLLVLLISGCGGGEFDTAPVTGVITVNGQPVENASVTFTPQVEGQEVPISTGMTDAEGRYELTLTATQQPGAVVGKHTVTVFLVEESESDITVGTPRMLPPHDLTFDVEDGDNTANFELSGGGSRK